MSAQTIAHFKNAVPATIAALEQGGCFSSQTLVVESGFEITFEKFYEDYPLKRNRYKAEKYWATMNKSDQVEAWASLTGYKKYLKANSWLKQMICDRYLRDKEYKTEWSKIAA